MRFNPPPGWPVEPGWAPTPGWEPPTDWDAPPYGWQLWLPAQPESAQITDQLVDEEAHTQASFDGDSGPETELGPRNVAHPNETKKALWVRAAENPVWTTLGALVGIVGLVLSIVQVVQAMQPQPVDLELAALTMDNQQSLAGIVADQASSVAVAPIDLTLQNRGGEPALITSVVAEVVHFRQLEDCSFAKGPLLTIAAKYQLAIPMEGVEPAEKHIASEVRFEVKPGAVDRMVFSLGPKQQPNFKTAPMVISAKIKLIHDDNQILDVGTVSVVTTLEAATAQTEMSGPSSKERRSCAQANLERLETVFAIQARRSPALDRLRSAYQAAAIQ